MASPLGNGANQADNCRRVPASLPLVAYGFIGLGLIGIISSAASFFTVPLLRKALIDIAAGHDQPAPDFGPALAVLRHAPLSALISIILGTFTVYAGRQFAGRRSWARLTLEVFSWIGLVLSGLIAALFVFSFIKTGPLLVLFDDPVFTRMIRTTIILCLAVAIFFIVPNLLLVIYLRSKAVRRAMRD